MTDSRPYSSDHRAVRNPLRNVFPGLGFICFIFAVFHAALPCSAGEMWEWMKGKEWTRGEDTAWPTAAAQFRHAYRLDCDNRFAAAARQYFLLTREFPDSEEAGIGLQRLARCLYEMGEYWTSYKALEQAMETYPQSCTVSNIVEIELHIAKALAGNPITANRHENAYHAFNVLDSVLGRDPQGPFAPEAHYIQGEVYLRINCTDAARASFETVLEKFPESQCAERARLGMLTCDAWAKQPPPLRGLGIMPPLKKPLVKTGGMI